MLGATGGNMQVNTYKLEKERVRRSLRKRAFAELLGVHENTYHYILKTRSTSLSTITSFAAKLDFDPKDLLTN